VAFVDWNRGKSTVALGPDSLRVRF
jgi:hypothetical protein